jgi:inward rectifier potassium channel
VAKPSSVRFTDNRGRPTIEAIGLPRAVLRDLYHRVLTAKWRWFFLVATLYYLSVHAIFALLYLLQPGSIVNAAPGSFWDAYFFSVQTWMTIGYGVMSPGSFWGHWLVTIEAFLGMLTTAVITGLVFAKFARPTANILFSDVCCVSNVDGVPTLSFRMANARGNRLVEAALTVNVARTVRTAEGESFRRVIDLKLVRSHNPMFFVGWTALHRIDEASPLLGHDVASLKKDATEILVVLTGLDEDIAATVHARKAYGPDDIRWGHRFADIVTSSTERDGVRVFDYRKFHDTLPLADA